MKGGNKIVNNKTNWWIIIAVVVIVAVIASFATMRLTGNTVKVISSASKSAHDVYTKAEIDSIVSGLDVRLVKLETLNAKPSGDSCSEKISHIYKVNRVYNGTTGYANDMISLVNFGTGETYNVQITTEGAGTLTIAGTQHSIVYSGSGSSEDNYILIDGNLPKVYVNSYVMI